MMLSEKIINRIKSADKYMYIKKVGVFGSFARNEETVDSDIDILIDYDNSSDKFLDDLDDFMEDIESSTGNTKVDFVTMNGLLKSMNEQIKESILNDVIWIYSK